GDRVSFQGFAANPWAWFSKAALFVLPSRWEGFPSVVAEALACGVPALVTACDFGPREVVEHGESGWVTPPDDPVAFAAAMDHLLGNAELGPRLAAAGEKRARAFDIHPMVESYTRLFLEQAAAPVQEVIAASA
ncbi:MAG TPA: glycosyltransferase, partial [Caulobacteraceae bacterium]